MRDHDEVVVDVASATPGTGGGLGVGGGESSVNHDQVLESKYSNKFPVNCVNTAWQVRLGFEKTHGFMNQVLQQITGGYDDWYCRVTNPICWQLVLGNKRTEKRDMIMEAARQAWLFMKTCGAEGSL